MAGSWRKPDQAKIRLGEVGRAGFQHLSDARDDLEALSVVSGVGVEELLSVFSFAADPDSALAATLQLCSDHPEAFQNRPAEAWQRLCLLFGASPALGLFYRRHPALLADLLCTAGRLRTRDQVRELLLDAVGADPTSKTPTATHGGEYGATALRVKYRELLGEVMLHDLVQGVEAPAQLALESVALSLSHLADAALEAGLAVARKTLIDGLSNGAPVTAHKIEHARLAIVSMGKCGAEELNVVSDVDVVFIAESENCRSEDCVSGAGLAPDALIRLASQLATETMRTIQDPGLEPPLWQVDPNLRPEGRHGPLVRSLSSMITYYERWAKTWEFQALLKARPSAGDLELGESFVQQTRVMVWESSSREDFVGSVQRMRERVTEHINPDELDIQLKLGPGGLRDIEFSVQLLQLVHGARDEQLRIPGTLPALRALVNGGYVSREDGELLGADYRFLRVLEHRLQLRDLRRTALMPTSENELRILARSSRFATTGADLFTLWRRIRGEVRDLHLKIFYAPLLNMIAALPDGGFAIGSEEARSRLKSLGFKDPDGAMRHLQVLTRGSSRAAKIQRNLLPALLQWLSEGRDPDYGLLAFRRVSEANASTPWYLRLLRDGAEAAERLTRVLSSSRFAAELLESIPAAVGWLEKDELLRPVELTPLLEEMRALASRRDSVDSAAEALRAVHRREVLRLALGRLVFVNSDADVAHGLDAAHTALLDGLLLAIRMHGIGRDAGSRAEGGEPHQKLELSLIAMGRFGGKEMGFSSDIDLIAVYRAQKGANDEEQTAARVLAEKMVAELRRLVSDPRFAVDLDFDLRPEGKNGPLVRSLDAYRAYYERWSVTWEAQALLRARHVAGDHLLGQDFISLANKIRYPAAFLESDVREVRRIKARVESERLPRGAEPRRHLKLGPGGLSDVEWLVQLLQLKFAASFGELQTESTLGALEVSVQLDLLESEKAEKLRESWVLASRIRSAIKLWDGRGSNSLPRDRVDLEGIAGILGMPSGRTTELEDQWFGVSRRARGVFEQEFFGYDDGRAYSS